MEARGTVTPFSSIFPADEVLKASQRVQQTLIEKREELDTLNHFAADNSNLINLVKRLPDELHHPIMVPFGKAAFFPGRLVHTNELTVFLGENYYAERTAKQTIDILKRRGKTLDSHADSLKAVIEDLKTEASFFNRTAGEAEEGLVEIREEYTDEDPVVNKEEYTDEDSVEEENTDEDSVKEETISGRLDAPRPSEEGSGGGPVDDEEYDRIMSRFDELEKEELEAGDNLEDDEHGDTEELEDDEHEDFEGLEDEEHGDSEEDDEEHEDTEESEDDQHDDSSDNLEHGNIQPHAADLSDISHRIVSDKLNLGNLIMRSRVTDESSHGKALMQTEASMLDEKDYVPSSILKTRSQFSPKSKQVSFQIPEPDGSSRIVESVPKSLKAPVQMPKSDAGSQLSSTILNTDTSKAFSGNIVERTDNLPVNSEKQTTKTSNSQTSRPVSRFKMQRMAQGSN